MGIVSKVISTVRKIDSIHAMVEGAVKKIDEVYVFVEGKRHLVFPESTLIYEKTTGGSYSFTVPEKYDYVMIEYAGACGGRRWHSDGDGIYAEGDGGKGSIKKERVKIYSRHISGVVGQRPIQTYEQEYIGGIGYNNGGNGAKQDVAVKYVSSGGGGGSTSVSINGNINEASGGGGAGWGNSGPIKAIGGKGGGIYGGINQTSFANGNNATDPNQIGLNSGNGYVKIYGIAG